MYSAKYRKRNRTIAPAHHDTTHHTQLVIIVFCQHQLHGEWLAELTLARLEPLVTALDVDDVSALPQDAAVDNGLVSAADGSGVVQNHHTRVELSTTNQPIKQRNTTQHNATPLTGQDTTGTT
jgi:hypothetical protein